MNDQNKDLFGLSYSTPTFLDEEGNGPGLLATALFKVRATNRSMKTADGQDWHEAFIQLNLDANDTGSARTACTANDILAKVQDQKVNGKNVVIGGLDPELVELLHGMHRGRKIVNGEGKHVVPFETYMPSYDSADWSKSINGGYRRREFHYGMLEEAMNGVAVKSNLSGFGAVGVNKVPTKVARPDGSSQILWLPQDLIVYMLPRLPTGRDLEECAPGTVPLLNLGMICFLGHEGEESIWGNIQTVLAWLQHEDNIPYDMGRYSHLRVARSGRSDVSRAMDMQSRGNRRGQKRQGRPMQILNDDPIVPPANAHAAETKSHAKNGAGKKPTTDKKIDRTKKKSRSAGR